MFRSDWPSNEPRLISVGLLSCYYVLAFLRVSGLTRTNRILGPLRITLTKMLGDVFQFFAIFGLVMFAYAIGVSELYWHYGISVAGLCNTTDDSATSCEPNSFSTIGNSIKNLFWALFGYLNVDTFTSNDSHSFIDVMGSILVGAFHFSVILIMLNMLIAMMSKSFEVTSANEETEWRFYRAVIWVRFIRGDFTCPPPMNLLPNFYYIYRFLRACCLKNKSSRAHENSYDKESFYNRLNHVATNKPKTKLTKLSEVLIHRYKLHHLIPT